MRRPRAQMIRQASAVAGVLHVAGAPAQSSFLVGRPLSLDLGQAGGVASESASPVRRSARGTSRVAASGGEREVRRRSTRPAPLAVRHRAVFQSRA